MSKLMKKARIIPGFVAIAGLLCLAVSGCTLIQSATPTTPPAQAPTVTAGISIEGYVRLDSSDGPGLANVQIYAKGGYGATEGPTMLLATTDKDGFYWNGNAIPGMIVHAELDGYTFAPETWSYLSQDPSCTDACDFIAKPSK